MSGRPQWPPFAAHILGTMRRVRPLVINLLVALGFAALVSKLLGWVADAGREVQLVAIAVAFAGAYLVLAVGSERSSSHR